MSRSPLNFAWSKYSPKTISEDIDNGLMIAETVVRSVADYKGEPSYEKTLGRLDRELEPLSLAWSRLNHLLAVADGKPLRDIYNKLLPRVTSFFASIPLDSELWLVLTKLKQDSDHVASLSLTKQRHLDQTIEDFEKEGAKLECNDKEKVRLLKAKLAKLSRAFAENCLDATNAWEKLVEDDGLLRGLSETNRIRARQSAEEKGLKGWRFTLQASSYGPVLEHAENEELRKEVWHALNQIGRDGPFNNESLIKEILKARHELANILGYRNFVDFTLSKRMAKSAATVSHFIENLLVKIRDRSEEEQIGLRAFRSQELDEPDQPLEPWDAHFWAQKKQRASHDFDLEELRAYFPREFVISGMFELVERLFGLCIVKQDTTVGDTKNQTQVWHPDVEFYHVYDQGDDQHVGSFYADWFPRESKRSGAWMQFLATGNRDPLHGENTPHLGVICANLSTPVDDKPALLSHFEVEVIFHEFGHLLHHLCGNVSVKALNGVKVALDFVELPSQIMQNWCWEKESLALFAAHYETGEAIPDELLNKLLCSRNYLKATQRLRQLRSSKIDLELHTNWHVSKCDSIDRFLEEALKDFRIDYKRPEPSAVMRFHHLFKSSEGYAAGYYSYLWSEALEADAFSRFKETGVLSRETGMLFKQKILSSGNSTDPDKLFRSFMNRDFNPDALLKRDGLF